MILSAAVQQSAHKHLPNQPCIQVHKVVGFFNLVASKCVKHWNGVPDELKDLHNRVPRFVFFLKFKGKVDRNLR